MKTSTDRILTTHVGSLPSPGPLDDAAPDSDALLMWDDALPARSNDDWPAWLEAMARVERCGHRRAKIHIAEPHHQIAGFEDDLVNVFDRSEPVDAADEFDVARTPWCVGPSSPTNPARSIQKTTAKF